MSTVSPDANASLKPRVDMTKVPAGGQAILPGGDSRSPNGTQVQCEAAGMEPLLLVAVLAKLTSLYERVS
jgi:hypothetical protein